MASKQPTRTTTARAAIAAAGSTAGGLQGWIEVFRAGQHTDSAGQVIAFSNTDLDQMVANVALGKPPAVLGHPKHDDPAYGWADLKRDGTSLYAKFDELHPAFEAGVQSGAYRNRSVAVIKDKVNGWRVRHIGWLGAAPPAIDGLRAFGAPAGAEPVHEFSADDWTTSYALGDVATLLRGLRDWVISKDGLDTADKVLPDWTITSVQSAAVRIREQAAAEAQTPNPITGLMPAFVAAGNPNAGAAMSFTQEDLNRAATEGAARARTEAEATFAAQGAELVRLQGERQTERIGVQIAGWKAVGLVAPAEEAGMAEFMATLESAQAVQLQFTAADNKPAKLTPAAWFTAFVASRKPVIKLGAHGADAGADLGAADLAATFTAPAGATVDAASMGVHQQVVSYQRKRPGTGYNAALEAVLAGAA